jgi:hypothetical protein
MFGSIAAEKWLKETAFAVTEVAELVGDIDHVIVGDVVPDDVSLPAVLITGTNAMDITPVGSWAKVTAETLRFAIAVVTDGQSYDPIVGPATALHNAIHGYPNAIVTHPALEGTYFISCERKGELPMRRITAQGYYRDVSAKFVQLGGEYELQVTQGG